MYAERADPADMFGKVDFLKYAADQPRDSRGRFTAGDAEAAAQAFTHRTLAQRHGDDVRKPARELAVRALSAMHQAAANLAMKASHAVTSTRLSGASPVHGGGIEIRATHELPEGQGHVASYLQVHPWQLRHAVAQRAVSALHDGLVAAGKRLVPVKQSAAGVTFKSGAAA